VCVGGGRGGGGINIDVGYPILVLSHSF